MAYLDTTARTTRPRDHDKFQPVGRIPALTGVFVGFVKNADDVQRNGRLSVWIPEFGSAPEEKQGWVTVSYCSPFAGATNIDTISRTDKQSFESTQTSYGMWMVPPDINNEVLVMFIAGDPAKGVWIGTLYNQFMNQMVPGVASSASNYQHPGKHVPVAEYNKWDTSVTNPDRTIKPYHRTKFRGVGNQGLIKDRVRGTNTSSARREAPSQVYGILTPGPAIDPNVPAEKIRRKGGSSFVMDDGTGSEHIQLSTKSGAQIKIDETNGFIYLINRDGTAWVQMDRHGNIDIFGANNISMRSQRDLNIRADRNINIEAGQNIFMKAAKDTVESTTKFTHAVNNESTTIDKPVWKYVGEGNGIGGNIVMQALNDWHSTTKNSAFITVKDNNLDIAIGTSLLVTTVVGGQDFKSRQGIKLTSAGSIDVAADGTIKVGASDHVSISSSNDVNVCAKDQLSLNGDTSVAIKSLTEIGLTGQTLFANQVWFDDDVLHRKSLKPAPSTNNKSKAVPQPNPAQCPFSAQPATQAEVKALKEHLNIKPTWQDPDTKFIRDSESIKSTVTRLPTYEPSPIHEDFKITYVTGFTETGSDREYVGSSGEGNGVTSPPKSTNQPGENNKRIIEDTAIDSVVTKDFDMDAFRNQLVINEGYKEVSYRDSVGLLTAGIGHLLRSPNETSRYPLGAPVSKEQIETWYRDDAAIAIKGAMDLVGTALWEKISDVRKRALADLCYNLGKGKLAKFVKFLSAVKAENWGAAGAELQNSAWYNQVKSRGPRIITMITNNTDPHKVAKK